MSNMHYCMFENTYRDLNDCHEEMGNDIEELSDSEKKYRKKLITLCNEIMIDFGEELED